jgi:hypothetical protein
MIDDIMKNEVKYGSYKFKNPKNSKKDETDLKNFSSITHAKHQYEKDPQKFLRDNEVMDQ